jgi:nitrite reductase/ring-hydroxylating ferredoxin subunit
MSFQKICELNELENNNGRCFELSDKKITLFRKDGIIFAINNSCPHKGVSLCDVDVEKNVVTCPAHGWKFDIKSGKGLTVPSDVVTYNVKIEGNDMFIDI